MSKKYVNIRIWVVYYTEPQTADQGERICFSKSDADEVARNLERAGISCDIEEEIVTNVEVE